MEIRRIFCRSTLLCATVFVSALSTFVLFTTWHEYAVVHNASKAGPFNKWQQNLRSALGISEEDPTTTTICPETVQVLAPALNLTDIGIDAWLDAQDVKERVAIGSRLMLLPRGDGFGTHVIALVSALAYCNLKNITYVHWPWHSVGHCPTGMTVSAWSASLQDFTGLVTPDMLFNDSLGAVPAIRWLGFSAETINAYFNPEFLAATRGRYMSFPPGKKHSDSFAATNDTIRIAVHVRRGDVRDTWSGRYTSNSRTLEFMQIAEREIQAQNALKKALTFHIYSEGAPENFTDLVQAYGPGSVYLHLNEELKVSFHDLASADVLVMAKSGVSYAAALLSGGTVFYQPFWMRALSSWRVLPR